MTEEDQLELVRKSLGLKPKELFISIPATTLLNLISTASYTRGLLTATALYIKKANSDLSDSLLVEADNIGRQLSRQLYECGK